MTKYLKVLSEAEFDKLKDAIALITVYISGADGHISEDELKWAEKIALIRGYSTPDGLKEFYEEVALDFHDRVEKYVKSLTDLEERNRTIEQKLAELNPILDKLNPKLASKLYSSYLSFAKHVAKASGGFLGFFSISKEESSLLDLKMINPIFFDEEGHISF